MGFMDKFADIFKERPEDDFDDFYDDKSSDFDMPPKPVRRSSNLSRNVKVPKEEKPEKFHRFRSDSDKVVNIHTTAQVQVVLVKPEQFSDAPSIADNLKSKRTVVLNLESTNRDIARRLLDFLSGCAYADEGSIKRVANSTYIITPYNVDVLGDDILDELEHNGMFM
ncbi:MAG: cell division protein SepF [Eubacterium sp.]|nr:cell division protein SepF [Eubacterium sp.]